MAHAEADLTLGWYLGNGKSVWILNTNDALGTSSGQVDEAGYLDASNARLKAGDLILVFADQDGTKKATWRHVLTVTSGVVDIEAFAS